MKNNEKAARLQPSIVFSDNHLLVLNKPAGWLTQPTPECELSLETWAKEWVKKEFNKPGNVFLHAVHRIDKPVSGLVLFARTSKALSRLQDSLRQGAFTKTYVGLIEGTLSEKTGEWTDWITHDDHRARIVGQTHPEGKKCTLTYRVLHEKKTYTTVEITLKTGRYHQIRLQFSTRGHPLVGDNKYGSCTSLPVSGVIGLHHRTLHIPHPISHAPLSWECLPPVFWHLD